MVIHQLHKAWNVQFPTNGRGMNSNFLSNPFLFHSCLKKGLNLIPLYQIELCIFET